MTKILVGLVTRENSNKRNILRVLAEHLNIKHESVEAPLINAMSGATGIDALTLTIDAEPFAIISSVGCTIDNLKTRFKSMLEMNEPNFLVNELEKSIYSAEKQRLNSVFNGHLVSDITNTRQSDFIRKNNGVIVHVVLENSRKTHPIPIQKNDYIITLKNSEPIQEHVIYTYCKDIKSRYHKSEQEAA